MHNFREPLKAACTATAAVVLAIGLSGCKRESDTTVTAPPAAPPAETSSSSTTSSTTVVQPTPDASVATQPGTGATIAASAPSESMARLQAAAQRLREAIQAMAQEPAGDRRNNAIKQGNEALIEINQAMINLPPEMRSTPGSGVGTTPSAGASGSVAVGQVYPKSDVEYTKAMEKLQKAAQQLRESIQAMAQEPAGARRDDAIKSAHKALNDTTQSMIQLPPDMRASGK